MGLPRCLRSVVEGGVCLPFLQESFDHARTRTSGVRLGAQAGTDRRTGLDDEASCLDMTDEDVAVRVDADLGAEGCRNYRAPSGVGAEGEIVHGHEVMLAH